MRCISFGKLTVQNAGTPVNLGVSSVAGSAMTASDASFTVNSASPFSKDMVPFKLDIDPGLATFERVVVRSISGSTFVVDRGADTTTPYSHSTGAVVAAIYTFAGWDIGVVAGQSGKTYWGRGNMSVSTRYGVIKEFWPNASGAVQVTSDQLQFMPDHLGNPLNLTDYGLDVAVSGEGMHVTLWQR